MDWLQAVLNDNFFYVNFLKMPKHIIYKLKLKQRIWFQSIYKFSMSVCLFVSN